MYNLNVDLVTKIGLNQYICSQDLKKKLNSGVNQEPLPCCKFAKNDNLLSQLRSCQ